MSDLGTIAAVNNAEGLDGFWPRTVAMLLESGKIDLDDVRVAMGRLASMGPEEYDAIAKKHGVLEPPETEDLEL